MNSVSKNDYYINKYLKNNAQRPPDKIAQVGGFLPQALGFNRYSFEET
jgi:hypothetical protein